MALIPVFRIGLWNAWIPMLVTFLLSMLPFMLDTLGVTVDLIKKMGEAPIAQKEQTRNLISSILMVVLYLYSIFLPLKLTTMWFFVGLCLWLIGVFIFLSALITAAVTSSGKVFTIGAYRFSRHPLYLSMCMVLLAVGIASASWLFLLISTCYSVLMFSFAASEERACLETFGEPYREYMQRTSRWLGRPKA